MQHTGVVMLIMSLWSMDQILFLQPTGTKMIFAFKSPYLIPHRKLKGK